MRNKKMMKRFLSVILSAALIGGMITVMEPQKAEAAEQQNITIIEPDFVVSQDFESASDYNGKWRNQSTGTGTLEFTTDPENTKNQVLKYTVTGLTSGSSSTFDFNNGDVQIFEKGKTYTLSYRYKSDVSVNGYHANIDNEWNTYGAWMEASTEWKKVSIKFTPNDSLKTFQIGFQLLGDGTFYLDDFSIACGETEKVIETVSQVFTADFEQAEEVNKVLANPGTFAIDTTEKKSGTGSLKLGFTSAWSQLGIGTFELKAGTEYTISYDWKITDYTQADATQNAYSRLVKPGDIYKGLVLSGFQKSETDWTTVTYSYTPEEDVTAAIYMEVGGGTATMWVDNLSVSYKTKTLAGIYELSSTTFGSAGPEHDYYYYGIKILPDAFADSKERISGQFDAAVWRNYVSLSRHDADDMEKDGSYMRWYGLEANVFQGLRLYSKLQFENGEILTIKKNLPITYTTADDKEKTILLDKNYSFVYSTETGKFTYDSTLDIGDESVADSNVTISQPGTASFDTEADVWKFYTIPKNPKKVPGTEGVTTFHNVKIQVEGKDYEGIYQRADDTNGLCLIISSDILPADAKKALVTVKAGQYTTEAGATEIKITEDYEMYFYDKAVYQYEGDIYHESDNGTYVAAEPVQADGETVRIDNEAVAVGAEYKKSGDHVMTYTSKEVPCAMRLMIYKNGDVNGDESISISDLVAMKKYIQTEYPVSQAGEKAADMNIDTKVTDDDVKLLRKYQCTSTGVLALSPVYGQTAASANKTAEAVIANYEKGITDKYKTGGDIYYRNAVMLKWISFVEDADEYIVKLAKKADMSDAVTYKATECTLAIENLLADQDYYWTVQAGEAVSDIQTFHTQATVRTLTVEGVSNTRDCGGYKGLDGKTVKQGVFYRGAKLDNITEAGIAAMKQLAIKTDLDLRNSDEIVSKESPLGTSVNYLNYSGPWYTGLDGINTEAYKEALANEIRTFAEKDNYPIYVHCSIGRDRTGTLCFLINALLGVSEQDLYLDYEFSMLSAVGSLQSAVTMNGNFKNMYDYVQKFAPNGTIAEATEAFMKSIGITDTEIAAIRNLLLE